MSRKKNLRERLKKVRRFLDVKLKEPEECLYILERIVEKGRPVNRNLLWYLVDSQLQIPLSNLFLVGSEKYTRLKKKYDRICERADEINDPIRFEIGETKHFDKDYLKVPRLALKLGKIKKY